MLLSEPETRVYTVDSIEELLDLQDKRSLFYVGAIADVCEKYILVERLHNRNLSKDEVRQENIAVDKILTAELRKYNIPFKDVEVTFFDDDALPAYLSCKYYSKKPNPYSLAVLLPFFLP